MNLEQCFNIRVGSKHDVMLLKTTESVHTTSFYMIDNDVNVYIFNIDGV